MARLPSSLIPLVRAITMSTGVDPKRAVRALRAVPRFVREYRQFAQQSTRSSLRPTLRTLFPVLHEATDSAGSAGGHYFWQDLWAARRIYAQRPARHVDIGSRVDGFIAHLLVFMPVEVVDIRPLTTAIEGLSFVQDDATALRAFADNSLSSVSSLHAVEHFGLGRYGDPIDPDACFRMMSSLARVLAPGGKLYFSVPVGRERVEFNAHRVFSPHTIVREFSSLKLDRFCAVTDDDTFLQDVDVSAVANAEHGCGLFEFSK